MDDLLFTINGKTPLDQGNVRHRFYAALKAAGLEHASVQSLRHTFASVMINSGASVKALQRGPGHANATMTLNTSECPRDAPKSPRIVAQLLPHAQGTIEALLEQDAGNPRELPKIWAWPGVVLLLLKWLNHAPLGWWAQLGLNRDVAAPLP